MTDAAEDPPPRFARLVLVTMDGSVIGSLPPVPVATPWWQDIAPVVAAVREHHGIEATILRLLSAQRAGPHGGLVTYLAEAGEPVSAEPWYGTLGDDPLRLPYARAGGPAADLAWAEKVLGARGIGISGTPEQIRTWNLSSLWRIPTEEGSAWLKVVPPFFAHEGIVLEELAGGPVPRLIGHDRGRVLLAEIPGEDLYEAKGNQLLAMVDLLVGLQRNLIGRTDELLALGLPDWRGPGLAAAIEDVATRTSTDLAMEDRATLGSFVSTLPRRFADIDACGLQDTLVHGDFHPGNFRGTEDTLTLLDWGDSGVGHPLLDQPAFLERVPPVALDAVRQHWVGLWRDAVPGSDPARAATLLAPVAAARQAVIYRKFLDNIEMSEQVYHRGDPAMWLRRTASLLRDETA